MEQAKKRCYKYCIVPKCKNSTRSIPDKVFFPVPRDAKVRKRWCKVMRRDEVSPKSCLYCCEDHFNVEKDTDNYVEYNIKKQYGAKCKLRLKKGVVPHKFFSRKRKRPRKSAVTMQNMAVKNEAPIYPATWYNEASSSSQSRDNGGISSEDALVDTPGEQPAPAQNDEPPAARDICAACKNHFDGFVYQCVQCEFRMCGACDRAGAHSDHYVLRAPAHSARSEVAAVLDRVRAALEPLQLKPPQRARKRRSSAPHQPDEIEDTDSAEEEEPPVEVKMELDIHEHDPLEAYELPVVKSEPLDDAPPRPVKLLQVALSKSSAPQGASAPLFTVSTRLACPTPTAATHRPAVPQSPPGGPHPSGSTLVNKPQSVSVHVEEVNIKLEPQDEGDIAPTSAASPAPGGKRGAGGLAPGQDAVSKKGRPRKKKMESSE